MRDCVVFEFLCYSRILTLMKFHCLFAIAGENEERRREL